MNATVIILLILGVLAIIISCFLTSKSEGDEKQEEIEKVNPNLKNELSESDKKQLRKLTDNYLNEYSKKRID